MITFKNRFAEFDNLDDSYNENSLKNCYFREFRRNNLRFNLPKGKNGNIRYNNQNYNDIRLKNFPFNNNNLLNSQKQKNSFTPFPRIPLNNRNYNNNLNNYNSIQNDMNYNLRQNNNLIRSTPNYSKLRSNSNISTPLPFYNSINNNSFNNNSFENSFNNSNDNSQYFNENENMLNNANNNYEYDYNNNNNLDNSLNISNEYNLENSRIENEIKKEKQRQILLEQQRLNQIEKELREIRLKRNQELKRKIEQKKDEELLHQNRLKRIKKINNSYSIYNRNRRNRIKQNLLEEAFKMNLINDRIYMNGLLDEIKRIKLYQNEANNNFKQKMEDLYAQNELINNYNKDLMSKIKEMKYAVKEREDNPDTINDYLIEQKTKGNNRYHNYFKNANTLRNNYRYNNVIDDDKFNNYNYKNYFLGKKDKDIEEFNLLNQNLVNGNNGTVVSPLIYDKNNKNNKKIKLKSMSRNENENNKDDIYSLLRKNNDRLDRIKEIEDQMNYENS